MKYDYFHMKNITRKREYKRRFHLRK